MKKVFLLIGLCSFCSCGESTPTTDGMGATKESLSDNGATLCTIYKEIGDMEAYTRTIGESRYPNDAVKMNEYIEELRDIEKKEILKKNGLTDSAYTYILVYGMKECK